MKLKYTLGAALLVCATVVRADPPAPVEHFPALWKMQEITLAYSGFTAKYSCQGLRDKVREIVLALGARKSDLKATPLHCGNDPDRPAPFPAVKIRMATVLLAVGGKAGQTTAHWQAINLQRAAGLERGDCELLEQVRQSLLPLFVTRGVLQPGESCTPGQLPTADPKLDLKVLIPDVVATQ